MVDEVLEVVYDFGMSNADRISLIQNIISTHGLNYNDAYKFLRWLATEQARNTE